MPERKKHLYFWGINAAVFLLLFLIQYNGAFSLKIGNANPMLPLALIVSVSMFSGELNSILFSAAVGIVTDGVASTPVCFNTILFMIIALAVSLSSKHLFNVNVRSAVVYGILTHLLYFLIRWIFVLFYINLSAEVVYVMNYIIPSVIYSAVFTVLFYFVQKKLVYYFYSR